jgi:SAM-dependent methyltransferase
MSEPRVLDPCCGSRMFWFEKNHPDVIYGDIRSESHTLCDGRSLEVRPDVIIDFTALPYENGQFRLVVFDPPHFENLGEKSWMAKKYGRLPKDWADFLKRGFEECFRVLHPDGVLIFKWDEHRISLSKALYLAPHRPLFGHTTSQNNKTHWCVFMKPRH